MANLEHVSLLRQGVEAWNSWREKNPKLVPDISGADLRSMRLREVNLTGANCVRANFNETDLQIADLSYADLHFADLRGACLEDANLYRALLVEACLHSVDLYQACLEQANLTKANIIQGLLMGSNFTRAVLVRTDLSECDLYDANFSGANLTGALLNRVQAQETNFNKAVFTGACIADWNINRNTKLDGIKCQYIYLDCNLVTEEWLERRPHSGRFNSGEFTKLFQKALSTVDLIFCNGVDWRALLISLEKLRIETQEAELPIQAIENKNDGAFVVRVNVPLEANKAEIERFVKRQYEIEIQAIDEKYQFQLRLQGERLEEYREQVITQRQANTDLRRIIEKMADKEVPKYDMRGSTFGNFADTVQSGAKFQDTQNIYAPEQRQNLTEAAAEIQQLLDQLAQTDPTSTVVAEAIHQEIKRNPTLKARLVSALKAGGLEALKAIFNHPLFSIPAETVKGWLEAE